MQKIVPHLWFDNNAKEAAAFYVKTFGKNSRILSSNVLKNTPSGDCDVLRFELWGHEFMSISAGPYFTPNPSISFMMNFDPSRDSDAVTEIDRIWKDLSDGGRTLMELSEYPFSKRYGWVQDKYGFSWQLILTDPTGDERPPVIPSLMFTNEVYGKAEEATDFYISVFKDAKRGSIARYPAGMQPDEEGKVMFSDFMLEGQWFAAMESAREHGFTFNEAVSLLVRCANQEEIDALWGKLSAVPEAEQCGWLKDAYGVSWQITPAAMDEMMESGDQAAVDRVTKAFLGMKKLDLAALRAAYEGR